MLFLMRLFLILSLLAIPCFGQDEKPDPAATYDAVATEFDAVQEKFGERYRAAAPADRQAILAERPDTAPFIEKMWKLASDHPDDPIATKALIWATTRAMKQSETSDMAYAELLENHLDSEEIGEMVTYLSRRADEKAVAALEYLSESSPFPITQGRALYSLASMNSNKLRRMAPGAEKEALEAEVIVMLEKAVSEFGELSRRGRATIGEVAGAKLFQMTALSIGKEAPEIEGENGAGVAMKLSDYRGQVVLIDFWGDW